MASQRLVSSWDAISAKWAWVELNYRPHAYQATAGEQEVRQEVFKSLTDSVICRSWAFGMPDNVGVNRQRNRQQDTVVESTYDGAVLKLSPSIRGQTGIRREANTGANDRLPSRDDGSPKG